MDERAITQYITDTFAGVETVVASGDTFFFIGPDHKMPFATLVTGDRYDQVSNLDRPGVFRLNLGVSKETYRSLFGPPPRQPAAGGDVETGHDFGILDTIMPHPVYAPMCWVCVLNPSDATFQTARSLLAEAHALAVSRSVKRATQG